MTLSSTLKLIEKSSEDDYAVNKKPISQWKEQDWNISYSLTKTKPQILKGIMESGKLDASVIKSYKKDGITSLDMEFSTRKVVDLDEVLFDETQSARHLIIKHSHVVDIQGSFLANGWNYDCSPIVLYELPDWKISKIKAKDPNSKNKYGILSGHHRITGGKGIGMTHMLADIYEYSNAAAVHAWSSRLNPVPVPTLPPTKEDVEKIWYSWLEERNLTDLDENTFETFVKIFGLDGFDPRTLTSLKKKFLLPLNLKIGNETILIVETGRKISDTDPRHLKTINKNHNILNSNQNGFSTDDPRCSGLFRDFMGRASSGQTIYVHLYVNHKELSSGLNSARKKLLAKYDSKMREFSEAIFHTNNNIGLYGDDVNMELEIKRIMKNLPFKFNGFLPQLLNSKNDRIETTLVDENGKEFKNAVYAN